MAKTIDLPYFEMATDENGEKELVLHAPVNFYGDLINALIYSISFVNEPFGPKELPEDEAKRRAKLSRLQLLKFKLENLK